MVSTSQFELVVFADMLPAWFMFCTVLQTGMIARWLGLEYVVCGCVICTFVKHLCQSS